MICLLIFSIRDMEFWNFFVIKVECKYLLFFFELKYQISDTIFLSVK